MECMTNEEKAEQVIRFSWTVRQSPELTALAAATMRAIERGDSETSVIERLGAFQVKHGQAIDSTANTQIFVVLSKVAAGW
jgi:hypothetical protein